MKRKTLRGLYSPELLESRIAPATFIVNTLADSGLGSLRDQIDAANLAVGADTIVFDPLIVAIGAKITLTTGAIDITDTLTIKGPGVDKMAINGDDNDRIFDIFDGDNAVLHPTTISGLSFEHGFAGSDDGGAIRSTESLILKNTVFSNNYAYLGGGAIHLDTKGKLSIASSTFLNNTALNGNGGAVYGQADGGISIVKSLVSGNTAPDGNGGGLYLLVPSSTGKPAGILVDGVTFLRNSAESGGGLWADVNQAKGKIIVKNSTFTDNGVTSSGGGLYLNNGPATVSGSTFSNNVAGTDGGGLASNATNPLTTLTIKGSRFEGNAATGNGGAIHLRHEVLASIAGSVFNGNKANGNGGAIAAEDVGSLSIAGSLIAGNEAVGAGGGIFLNDSTLVLKGSAVSGNTAGGNGGGVHATDASKLTVSGGSFTGNASANSGGGISTDGAGPSAVDLTVTGTLFSGNSAGSNGGGVFASGDGELLIKSAKVLGNITGANGNGGGVYLSSSTKITVAGSLFARNHAANGGGLFLSGSAVTLVTGSSFLTNTATNDGGGIAITSTVAVTIKSKITGNVAGVRGGGIDGPLGTPPVLTGSVIAGNFATTGPNIYLI